MFQYHNNILCIQATWLYNGSDILSESNYKLLVHRNKIEKVVVGGNGRVALIKYDSLPQRYKNVIVEKFGDPHKTTKKNSFKDFLEQDLEAVEFFNNYTLDNGSALPEKNKLEYVANATILNAINKVIIDLSSKRKALGGSSKKQWDKLSDIISELPKHTYPHSLPKNPRRLADKYKNYKQDGYTSLIHAGFCNNNSEKINEAAKIWLLARWADRVIKVANYSQLLYEYNEMAKKKGWIQLKEEKTLSIYLNKEGVKHLWYGHRYGDAASKEKYTYQHSTILPSMRDSLWYSDGTKLNYFYQDEKGNVATCQVYEVMDVYSEVLLGFHVSKTESSDSQYPAYKMAVQIAGHRPYQLGFDGQGGHKKLQAGNFLNKLSRLAIKTAPYNGRSKTIESAFGRFQSQFLKQDWFFTGQNITTKKEESKSNREFILANKNSLPTLKEVVEIYKKRRQQWNEAVHYKTGLPRIEMYRNSINPQAPEIGIWDMIDLFWVEREQPVTCAGYGISFTEKKTKYTYMVYNDDQLPNIEWLRNNIDKKFYVKFDPEDMSSIRLYEKDALGLRYVAEARTKVEVHRGKQEQEAWENEYIQKVKRDNEIVRIKADETMDNVLEEHEMLPEQYGLKSPSLLGVKSDRKKAANNIGKVQKRESNLVLVERNEDDLYDRM